MGRFRLLARPRRFAVTAYVLIGACVVGLYAAVPALFTSAYGTMAAPSAAVNGALARDFYATFFVSYALVVGATLVLAVARSRTGRGLAATAAVVSIVILGYPMEAYLTVKLLLCAGCLLALALRFSWPRNLILCAVSLAAFVAFQRPNVLFGETVLTRTAPGIGGAEAAVLILALASVALAACLVRALADMLREAEAAVAHLDVTIDRLSEFNQDLQRYARVADEEAITKERNRISREIHDISGYIFTNLVALMDAAISMGGRDAERLAELHAAARAQAKEGLQETRRALRALRASDAHRERGIAAIFKIKTVFERVTGIEVAVEAGNMPPSFGDEIDLAVYRIVQEALTNAMRHGRATRVTVQFWIEDGSLELCVQDDGLGAKEIAKGIGLTGMEERVGKLGGTVSAENAVEGGFRLRVRIPLA